MQALNILLVCYLLVHTLTITTEDLTSKVVSFVDLLSRKINNLGNDSCSKSCCASLPSRGAMTYHYYQNTGRFKGGSGEYAINTLAYSGQG